MTGREFLIILLLLFALGIAVALLARPGLEGMGVLTEHADQRSHACK